MSRNDEIIYEYDDMEEDFLEAQREAQAGPYVSDGAAREALGLGVPSQVMQSTEPGGSRVMQSTEPDESRASKRHRGTVDLYGPGCGFMDFAERVGDCVIQQFRAYEITMEVQYRRLPYGVRDDHGHCQLIIFMGGSPTRVSGESLTVGATRVSGESLGMEPQPPSAPLLELEQLKAMVLQVAKDGVSELCARFGSIMLLAQYGFKVQPRGFSCRLLRMDPIGMKCVLAEFEVILNFVDSPSSSSTFLPMSTES